LNLKTALALLTGLLLAAGLRAAEPDLAAPAFQDIRKAWLQEKTTLESSRSRTYRDMLEAQIQELDREMQEKIAARNVKGISVARKAKTISEEALASVQSNGTFTLPDTVRRELDDWLKKLTAERQAADKQADESLADLRGRYRSRFAQALTAQTGAPAPDEAALDALFDKLLSTEPPPPEAAKPAATNETATAAPAEPDSPWFASSGESTAWFPVGRLKGEIMAQDVFSIPVLNVTSSYAGAKQHPLNNNRSSSFTYELIRPLSLEEGARCAFRLKRLPDRKPVTVLAWPGPLNRGRLEFRTPPLPEIPSSHGFEIEAAVTNLTAARTAGAVDVQIDSEPAGAEIRLNGKLAVNSSGAPALTPARLRVPPAPTSLRLSLKDHVAKSYDKWIPKQDQRLAWKFVHETALPPTKALRLDPGKSWVASEVMVRPGDRIWLVPSGQWTVGTRGELCGPDGYPETQKFAHYYATGVDLRQKPDAPYGALLVKLSALAEPLVVTGTVCLQAPAHGALFFDVNEKTAKDVRRDNRGSMSVTIVVIPLAP
jgi:hypothetical protein